MEMVNKTLNIFSTICALLSATMVSAQTVAYVTAEQKGTHLLIHYDLSTEKPCDISLYVSTDGGKAWTGPLQRVSGDVGQDINSGNHIIRWEVLEEMDQLIGNDILFKVMANGQKPSDAQITAMKGYEPEMVFIEGGMFSMGSTSGSRDEQPVRRVTVSDFSIGKYEVTKAQWRAVMGSNPSYFSDCEECPVENVSWDDVQHYIKELNALTGKKYRLPTETEWEFAARGGNKSKGYTYSGSEDCNSVAWYDGISEGKPHPIGKKQPNELGIYDMSGNVWEWCSDWYGNYSTSALTDPTGPARGRYRVNRGGSCDYVAQNCRTSNRHNNYPDYRNKFIGFRLVLAPDH